MVKPMFDADALIDMFENASAKQGAQLKQATSQAVLTALHPRPPKPRTTSCGGSIKPRPAGARWPSSIAPTTRTC